MRTVLKTNHSGAAEHTTPFPLRRILARLPRLAALFAAAIVIAGAARVTADEAQWIWSPAFEKDQAPVGVCYFRKTFEIGIPEKGEIQIACDDEYDLFVNGREIGNGKKWKVMDVYDVTRDLVQGANCIAVRARNTTAGSAGLVARVVIKSQGNTHITYSTDATWKTAIKEFPQWQKTQFADAKWLAAKAYGALGSTLPWGTEIVMPGGNERFKVTPEFRVEWVIEPKQTGSLIAMAFDEFGQIIASRENGPLLIIRDAKKDGLPDTVETYCDEVKNCQGILSISGRTFVTGDGPAGPALYRLSDEDHDGKIDRVEPILKFSGEMGEHGPHSLVLGPDGLIYIVVGNFVHVDRVIEKSSPYHHYYEGDLVTPRYEDAAGHAVGVKAPGGTILRTDTNGSAVELFAGGLQNPYDIAFTKEGELFTADSDWEWDLGMPWYRPTRVAHVLPGAEFGWRSGWAKWPEYYFDSLPATVDTGRGSPTGIEVYNHFMYPLRYHNAMFVCDWSRGRILSVKLKPHGGTYKATSEVFLEGQPLNVTDIAVGPDGFLYFCTGGRETEGGIYRILWTGDVPAEVKNMGEGITAALRQPQLNSAWGRQRAALVKQQLGPKWGLELTSLARNAAAPVADRVRALELLQLFGPYPPKPLLVKLADDPQPEIRAKVAYLMGIHVDRTTQAKLADLAGDKDPLVQRLACESIVRSGNITSAAKVLPLLGSQDQFVSWSARRALEKMPVAEWQNEVLDTKDSRAFLNGAMALLVLDPTDQAIDSILAHCGQLLKGYLSDTDFLDLTRVVQLALIRGGRTGEQIPGLRQQLSDEYPSREPRMNRELVRLLVYLQDTAAVPRMMQQLEGDSPMVEKMQVALYARFLKQGLKDSQKLALLKFYEEARALPGGHSYAGYIENVSRDFFAGFNEKQRKSVLIDGAKWPTSALSVLIKLPKQVDPETLVQIEQLDQKVKKVDSDAARRLRIGTAAVLGASGDPRAMAYLRQLYENEPDRRVTLAMALAQHPDDENWPYLVKSLSIVEGTAAQEVLASLAQVDRAPDQPEPYRQVILRGLMLRENGASAAIALLEKWSGKKLIASDDSWETVLAGWQKWFSKKYPNEPEPKLPTESDKNSWAFQELLSYLTTSQGATGDARHGAAVFEKAQCAKCHRFQDHGDTVGPDLSTVAQRFQRKEILESILFPSQVISDQYASATVLTKSGKKLFGMVAPAGDGSLVVLEPSGEKVTVAREDIEETHRSQKSAMPEGLLNPLTMEEIADLFAYLTTPRKVETAKRPSGKAVR